MQTLSRACRRAVHGRSALGAAALLCLAAAACDTKKVLSVTDPDVARPSALTGASSLPAFRAGAVGNFGNAFNGPTADVEQIDLAGLLSDEFINTETFPTRIEIDQRAQTITNGSLRGAFADLTGARASADAAIAAYHQYAKTASDSAGLPEVLALDGYTYILFAENYCGAVPVSILNPDGSFTYGPPLTTQQLLDSAVSKFNQALAIGNPAVLTSTYKYLAQVGKGRALLDQGDFTGAASAVAGVPTTFQYLYRHSETSGRQNNGTWALTVSVARFGEADREGSNGLPFQSDGDMKVNPAYDPRVADSVRGGVPKPCSATYRASCGFDGSTTQYVQTKYPARSSSDVVADGVEARLIEAEASLHSGDAATALATLNALRSDAALLSLRGYATGSLTPLTPAATPDAQVDQLFRERAYWLYLTSHRLGDLRRLIRQYGRNAEAVFPTGPYFKGGTYGTDVNSPVPQAEQNNPNYKASACKQNEA